MLFIKHMLQFGVVVFVFAATFYLLLPEARIYPAAWTPAAAPAYEGAYAPNDHLASIERLASGAGIGPEDVAVDNRGRIYAGMSDGRIVRTNPDGTEAEDFADTVGRPLGLDFDKAGNLIVADAYQGLLSITPDGTVRRLAREHGGRPFRLTDDVDVAPDGTIYLTDASDRFYLNDYVLDLLEHQPNGRLLSYDPRGDSVTAVLYPLYFANGVAVSPNGDYVLVVETGRYRVIRFWLKGPRRGERDIFIDNLPGFPDGISSDGRGTYWLALVSPRDRAIDFLLPRPSARKLVARLPRKLQPGPKRYSFVLGLDGDGNVVHNLQDPNGGFAQISSVERYGDDLYFGSLIERAMGRLPAP
jgi:sugar lactone lactonase YvrE